MFGPRRAAMLGVKAVAAGGGGRALPAVQNGGFTSGANWTIVQPGTATLAISGNALNAVGGTSASTTTCTQTLSGLTPGASYTFTSDTLSKSAAANGAVSLGGGTAVSIATSVGNGQSVTVIAGSSNTDLVVTLAGTMTTGARTWSNTNYALS